MSEPKWTPGPWYVGTDEEPNKKGYGGYLWSLHVFAPDPTDSDGQMAIAWALCSDDGAVDDNHAPRLRPARANAHLIAAAPELYEALIGVIRVADRATVEFDRARAALAKARGE